MPVTIIKPSSLPLKKTAVVLVFRPVYLPEKNGGDVVARTPKIIGSFVPATASGQNGISFAVQARNWFMVKKYGKPKKITPWKTFWVPYNAVGLHPYDEIKIVMGFPLLKSMEGVTTNTNLGPHYSDWIEELNSEPDLQHLGKLLPPKPNIPF